MQKYIIIIVFAILTSLNLFADDVKKYGKEITLTEKVKISQLLENPKNYEGKKVLIEGIVLNVCKKRGCWIELASDKEFESIRVKVQDGVIVFPMEVNGKKLNFILDSGVGSTILFNLDVRDSIRLNEIKNIQLQGLGSEDPVDAILSQNNEFKIKH